MPNPMTEAELDELERLREFLDSSGSLKGIWFGEAPAGQGPYWWRHELPLIEKAITAAREAARLREENATLRHWAFGHIDALLLYAAGSYPNDSHVRDAVAFCRLLSNKPLRMDNPTQLQGSTFHPARAALNQQEVK